MINDSMYFAEINYRHNSHTRNHDFTLRLKREVVSEDGHLYLHKYNDFFCWNGKLRFLVVDAYTYVIKFYNFCLLLMLCGLWGSLILLVF